VNLLKLRTETVEEVESLRDPCLEKRLLILPSHQVSTGSRVEVTDRQGTALAFLVEGTQSGEVDLA
jgi:hypothetical protein